jgi:capsid protein
MWYEADKFGLRTQVDKMGLNIEEVATFLDWVPAGRPWLDRTNEMSGHILAIAAGIESVPEVCSMYGKDAYKVNREQADFLKNAQAPLLYANGGQMAVQAIMQAMGNGTQPKQEASNGQSSEQV